MKKYLVISGIDGSGKTSVINALNVRGIPLNIFGCDSITILLK